MENKRVRSSFVSKPFFISLFVILFSIALGSILISCSSSSSGSSSTSSSTNLLNGNLSIRTYNVGKGPSGIAIDAKGDVWVANTLTDTVCEIITSTGTTITYPVGNGPKGLAIDQSGDVWVANTNVSEINPVSGKVTNYPVSDNGSSNPQIYAIAVDKNTNIWGLDGNNGILFELNSTGNLITYKTKYSQPSILSLDANGDAWIAYSFSNTGTNALTEVNLTNGNTITSYTINPHPYGLAIDQKGNIWTRSQSSVSEINPNTGLVISYTVWAGTGNIAIDAQGNVWVPNLFKLTEINPTTGSVIRSSSNIGESIDGIAIDKSGDIWLADGAANTVISY